MITYPRADIFSAYRLKTTKFQPYFRQTVSRTAGGAMIVVDRGAPVWQASYVTASISEDDCVEFQAVLNSLDGSVQAFLGSDTRREFPRLYPEGNFSDTGSILSLGVDRRVLSLTGLHGLSFRVGDRFSYQIGDIHVLHEIQEDVTANGGGEVGPFQVFPHVPPGLTTGTAVKFARPTCTMRIDPESVQYTAGGNTLGTVAFSATQLL